MMTGNTQSWRLWEGGGNVVVLMAKSLLHTLERDPTKLITWVGQTTNVMYRGGHLLRNLWRQSSLTHTDNKKVKEEEKSLAANSLTTDICCPNQWIFSLKLCHLYEGWTFFFRRERRTPLVGRDKTLCVRECNLSLLFLRSCLANCHLRSNGF